MTIEAGQLRRWRVNIHGLEGGFLVIRSQGMCYRQGTRRGDKMEEHWEILMPDGIMGGWSKRLLEELSEAIDAAG